MLFIIIKLINQYKDQYINMTGDNMKLINWKPIYQNKKPVY